MQDETTLKAKQNKVNESTGHTGKHKQRQRGDEKG